MKAQACQPCAKRKVRCDRDEPCSNCKRRKQDQCIYAEVSPTERIKQLEALVSSLGSSQQDTGYDHNQAKTKAASASSQSQSYQYDTTGNFQLQHRGTNPMIVKEDGVSNYLESWNGKIFESNTTITNDGFPRTPIPPNVGPVALQSVLCREPYVDVASRHPAPQDATMLWDVFYRRVHPVSKISFEWEMERLRAATVASSGPEELTFQEHALVFAVYLISIVSLSEDESMSFLKRPRSDMLSDFQMSCEQALAGSNCLGSSDLMTIQALILYILIRTWTAGTERLNMRSLWSLMGAVVRNAERSGLHRDGALLGLPPYETERRRRVWWQLQHIDLALGVRSGSISLTLTAPWDVRLPLNIEDEDIDPQMGEAPKEREGLTSMSHCLWTYWVIEQQRSFCRADGSRLGFSWIANKSLSRLEKDAFINRLQVGLNTSYLQFCDPIRPLDLLIQINARSFICSMRRVTLHPLAFDGKLSDLSENHRNELLEVCLQCLEYDVALHSNPSIQHFRWRFQGYFQWSALVYVLVEARRQSNTRKTERIWGLLSDLYAANHSLTELVEDRRKSYAVELIVLAWRARGIAQKPAFLVGLENRLFTRGGNLEGPSKRHRDEAETYESTPAKRLVPATGTQGPELPKENVALSQHDLDAIAEIDFDAIDWSFWDAIP